MNKNVIFQFGLFSIFFFACEFLASYIFYFISKISTIPTFNLDLLAGIVPLMINYYLNRKYTFQSNADIKKTVLEVLEHYMLFTILTFFICEFLIERFNLDEYTVEIVASVVNLIIDFLHQKYLVFKDVKDK